MGSSQQLTGKQLVVYKKQLVLDEIQKSVLVGTLLGDANLRILKSNSFLTVEHSDLQKDYVFWKYSIFKDWVLTPPRKKVRIYCKDTSRKLISWGFQTLSHQIFTEFYKKFYPRGKKIAPKELSLWINPLVLAVWLMDDGSRKTYGKGVFLHTQNFSLADQSFLIKVLKNRFGLEASLSSHGWWKGRHLYRLYINAKSFPKLKSIVFPYILPMFAYKIA